MLSCRLHSYLRFSATFLVNTWPILILRSSPKVYLIIICAISVFTHTQLFLKFKNCQGVFLQYGNNNIHLVRLWGFFCFFINLFIYLFIFGCVGSLFLCEGFLQLQRAGATLHRCAGLSLSCRGLLLRSTGSRRAGSVVVMHGLSCSAARGIFPDQGLNLCPLHWQVDS